LNPFDRLYKKCGTLPLSEKPEALLADIELVGGICNLQCSMCPVGLGQVMREKGFLKLSIFANLLQQLKTLNCSAIRFVRWGEPTLHPYFTKVIQLAKKQGFLIHLNTNGQLFDDDLSWAIRKYVDSIKFSFQGLNKHEYEKIRRGAKYDTIKEWIETLYKQRGRGCRPYISVGTTITKGSDAERAAFRDEFRRIADHVAVGKTRTLIGNSGGREPDSCPRPGKPRCPEFFKVSVNWDATVSFCCGDYDNLMLIGDLKKDSLKKIWYGESAVTYRKMLMSGRHSELPLCRNCNNDRDSI